MLNIFIGIHISMHIVLSFTQIHIKFAHKEITLATQFVYRNQYIKKANINSNKFQMSRITCIDCAMYGQYFCFNQMQKISLMHFTQQPFQTHSQKH